MIRSFSKSSSSGIVSTIKRTKNIVWRQQSFSLNRYYYITSSLSNNNNNNKNNSRYEYNKDFTGWYWQQRQQQQIQQQQHIIIVQRTFLISLYAATRGLIPSYGTDPNDELVERQRLYYALLVTHYRSLRISLSLLPIDTNTNSNSTSSSDKLLNDDTNSTNDKKTKEDVLNQLYITAGNQLEDIEKIEKQSIVNLRKLLQEKLYVQTRQLFTTFNAIDIQLNLHQIQPKQQENDNQLPLDQQSNSNDNNNNDLDAYEFVQGNAIQYQQIIQNEYNTTRQRLDQLLHYQHNGNSVIAQEEDDTTKIIQELAFLIRKLKAIDTICESNTWHIIQSTTNVEDIISQCESFVTNTLLATDRNTNTTGTTKSNKLVLFTIDLDKRYDVFGTNYNTELKFMDNESIQLLRAYQTINLCRNILLRNTIGYSIHCYQSCIKSLSYNTNPKTNTTTVSDNSYSTVGRGIYMDGICPAGSIVAFQPGRVYPPNIFNLEKELQLYTNDTTNTVRNITNAATVIDPTNKISLRYDSYIVDSRTASISVLVHDTLSSYNNNPYALGHMINHPPISIEPNTLSCMINYYNTNVNDEKNNNIISSTNDTTGSTIIKKRSNNMYIPNTYVKKPDIKTRILLDGIESLNIFNLFNTNKTTSNTDIVLMHGMCVIATNDISNGQEVLYDYNLPSSMYYKDTAYNWYKPVVYSPDSYFGSTNNSNNNNNSDSDTKTTTTTTASSTNNNNNKTNKEKLRKMIVKKK